jgi:hypothetical protein
MNNLVDVRRPVQPQGGNGAGGNRASVGAAASSHLSPEHRDKLASSALPAAQIEQLKAAGFRTDARGRLVIPYRNPDGTPQLMPDGSAWERVRLPQAKIEANPKGARYCSKKGAGCRLYHPVLSPDHAKRLADPKVALRFTEGELKGEACAFHDPDRVTIALGGVDCWRDSRSGESAPLPELEALELQNREVRLCWDSDVSKPSIRNALAKFSIWLAKEKKAHVLMERLPNAPERDSRGKVIRLGADDLIHGYGADGFRRICAELAEPCIVWKENKEGRMIPSFVMAHDPEPSAKDATFVRSVYLTALLGRFWQSDPEKGDSWRRWTGTHWQRIDGTDPINAAVERFLDCQGWRVARERHNVAGLVAAFRRQINPAADTSTADGLLPFANGCLRLADGVFLPHDAAHGNTWALPFGYEPEATSSAAEAFLNDRLGDPASVAVFRAFARALLVGDRLKCFLEITGPSNTGKSVLANVLQALVGTANTAAGTLQRIEDRTQRFETIKLRGKRLAVFSECQDFAGQLQVLKALTGGDPIPAEVKGGRHFDFTFGGGVVLVGNGPIRATDPTGAVINRRRSLLVTKVVEASAERQLLDPDGHGGWRGELGAGDACSRGTRCTGPRRVLSRQGGGRAGGAAQHRSVG